MKKYPNLKKKIPSYWWDFNRDASAVIVESDDDRIPIVTRFDFNTDATKAIELAEKYILDLKEGRINPFKK